MLEIVLVGLGLYFLVRWAVVAARWMDSPILKPSSTSQDSNLP